MREKSDNSKSVLEIISISLLASFTIGLYAPISIYCANANEYWYNLRLIWYVPVLVFVLLFTLMFLVIMVSRGLFRSVLMGAVFGIGLCLYLQGNFLNMKVGIFNGAYIDWDSYRGKMIANAVVWAILIISSIIFFFVQQKIALRVTKYISLLLVGMQLVSLIFLIAQTVKKEGVSLPVNPVFSSDQLCEVGDENIIVICLDTLDEEYIAYAMEEIQETNSILDGFIFYDNFASEYRNTTLSFPTCFVLGKDYHNEKPIDEWVEENGNDRLFFDELKDNGYDITIYTEMVLSYPKRVRDYVSNYREINQKFYNTRTCLSFLYKSAGCVYFPDITKPFIWMDDTALQGSATTDDKCELYFYRNYDFKNHLESGGISVKGGTKQFKMIHLRGTHEPFYIDEMGNEIDEHWDWKVAMKGCLNILDIYFNLLKEAGVYDDSTIIITGDHGYHCTRGVLSNPAFLLKPKNSHGNIVINSNEAGLVNFAATIADLAGAEDPSRYGLSILDIDENTSFDRYFYIHTLLKDGSMETGSLLEYITPVDTNDVRQYKLTGVEYTRDGKKIDHAQYCQTCKENIPPKVWDEWHVVDEHLRSSDYPYQ